MGKSKPVVLDEVEIIEEPAVLDNDAILAEISKHNEAIKVLKTQLQPTKPRVYASLLECNKAAKEQRAQKFSDQERMAKAVAMAISLAQKQNGGAPLIP